MQVTFGTFATPMAWHPDEATSPWFAPKATFRPSVAFATEARSGTAAPWTRYRPAGGVNRRTRRGKRWDAIRAGYVERMTRTPTPDDEDLLDSLADLRLDQERLRHRLTSGLSIGRRTMVELVTEIRRLRLALGLGTEAELTLGQLLGVD
jgi:hypothetical protein